MTIIGRWQSCCSLSGVHDFAPYYTEISNGLHALTPLLSFLLPAVSQVDSWALAHAGPASRGRGPEGQAENRRQEWKVAGKGQIGLSWLQDQDLLFAFLMEGLQMTVGPDQASHRRVGTVERETTG